MGILIYVMRMKENKKYKVLFLHPDNHFSSVALVILKKIPNIILFENDIQQEDYDFLFSVCYPKRITNEQRNKAKLAALNIHTGLLPQHRGSNPLNWALIWGDKEIGVTLHYMVDTYDAGDIVLQKRIPIKIEDNINDLFRKTKEILPELIKEFFEKPEEHLAHSWKQNQADMTYAQKRRPEDSELNLSASPVEIYNLWRSCDPVDYPAFVIEDGKKRIIKEVDLKGNIFYKDNI